MQQTILKAIYKKHEKAKRLDIQRGIEAVMFE